jgi:hypothetical protein
MDQTKLFIQMGLTYCDNRKKVLKFPAADPFTIDKWMVSLSFFKIENEK